MLTNAGTRIATCLLIVLLLGSAATADEKLTEALVEQERKLIEAIKEKDKDTITEMLSEEAVSITVIRGRRKGKEIVEDLADFRFDSYRINEAEAIRVSNDVAILTYQCAWTSGSGQRKPATRVYATSIWKLRDGKWRSLFYQETPVKQ